MGVVFGACDEHIVLNSLQHHPDTCPLCATAPAWLLPQTPQAQPLPPTASANALPAFGNNNLLAQPLMPGAVNALPAFGTYSSLLAQPLPPIAAANALLPAFAANDSSCLGSQTLVQPLPGAGLSAPLSTTGSSTKMQQALISLTGSSTQVRAGCWLCRGVRLPTLL